MFRRCLALFHALSVQHAGPMGSGRGRHLSSPRISDRSIAVANARSPTLHHGTFPALRFGGFGPIFSSAHSRKPIASSCRTYSSGDLAGDKGNLLDSAGLIMANGTQKRGPKPEDALNGTEKMPAGREEASLDPESDEDVLMEAEELQEALGRPPPVNSSYLPLPWKGRLGYVSRG